MSGGEGWGSGSELYAPSPKALKSYALSPREKVARRVQGVEGGVPTATPSSTVRQQMVGHATSLGHATSR